MLDLTLVTIGKIKEAYYQAAFLEYAKRVRPFVRLKVIELPAVPFFKGSQDQAREFEGETIENFLMKTEKNHNPAAVYLLAERGQVFNSLEFSAWLSKKQPLILIIGGSLGFSDQLYQQYPQLSLSTLTFPHELARVVLMEQIYRAATIINKKTYHY